MMKLMHIIILSCKQATYYSSIKNFKKLGWIKRLQLKMHMLMCKDCHEFDHQSEMIDQAIRNFSQSQQNISSETLSDDKKIQIKSSVNQSIN